MNIKIITVAVAFLCVLACKKNQPTYQTMLAEADSIRVVDNSNQSVLFQIRCKVPTPCWQFNYSLQTNSGINYYTKIYAQATSENPCAQAVTTILAPVQISLPATGLYAFYFWKNDSTWISKTIDVQ